MDINEETGKYTWSHAQGFRTFLRQTTVKFKSLQWAKILCASLSQLELGKRNLYKTYPFLCTHCLEKFTANVFIHRKWALYCHFFFFEKSCCQASIHSHLQMSTFNLAREDLWLLPKHRHKSRLQQNSLKNKDYQAYCWDSVTEKINLKKKTSALPNRNILRGHKDMAKT